MDRTGHGITLHDLRYPRECLANVMRHLHTCRLAALPHYGLIAIVGFFCILGVTHSVVVPLFEAPDEIWHFSFTQVLATQRALPVQPTEGKNVWLREAGQPPLYYLVAAPFVVAPAMVP